MHRLMGRKLQSISAATTEKIFIGVVPVGAKAGQNGYEKQ